MEPTTRLLLLEAHEVEEKGAESGNAEEMRETYYKSQVYLQRAQSTQ